MNNTIIKKLNFLFFDVSLIYWNEKNITPFLDANNFKDFGNIDIFEYNQNFYHLVGDWGDLEIQTTKTPKVEILF